ncbi:ribosome recycling factor [Patescibacteria group bacterium]
MEDILAKFTLQMEEVLELVNDDLKAIKTGRAKPSLIEDIKVMVESYGSMMALKELASITTPDSHMLVVNPWDKAITKDIEKAISKSEMNLSPIVENDIVRVKIPPLTEETRKDLVKLVFQKIESTRKLVRQARNESKSEIENQKGKPGISEDDIRVWLDKLQDVVDEYMKKIEEIGKTKEKELMTV